MIPLSREWLSRAIVRSQVARTLAGCGKRGAAAQILYRLRDFVTQEELGAHRLMALRFFFGLRTRFDLDLRCLHRHIARADQVIGGCSEGEDPSHLVDSAVPKLPQQRDRLQPPKALFNALPLSLN